MKKRIACLSKTMVVIMFVLLSSTNLFSQEIVTVPGSTIDNFMPYSFYDTNDFIYFVGKNTENKNNLYKIDKATGDVVKIAMHPGINNLPIIGFTLAGNNIYFVAKNTKFTPRIWKLNITTDAISLVDNVGRPHWDNFTSFVNIGDYLYYPCHSVAMFKDNIIGRIKYSDDTFEEVTLTHTDLDSDPEISRLTDFNGNLYFNGHDKGEEGKDFQQHLYKYNIITQAVTSLTSRTGTADLPHFSNYTGNFNPTSLQVVNDKLYLLAEHDNSFRNVLWEYAENSDAIALFAGPSDNFILEDISNLNKHQNKLFFISSPDIYLYDTETKSETKLELPANYSLAAKYNSNIGFFSDDLLVRAKNRSTSKRVALRYNFIAESFLEVSLPPQDFDNVPTNFFSSDNKNVYFNANNSSGKSKLYKMNLEKISTWSGTEWQPSTPDANTLAILDGNYTSSTGDITCAGLSVNENKTITVNSGQTLKITTSGVSIKTQANIIVEAGAVLNCDALNIPSQTSITDSNTEVYSTDINIVTNPNKASVKVQIEYGETTAYGSSVELPFNIDGEVDVSKILKLVGLKANTEYHYRSVYSTDDLKIYGTNNIFTTKASTGIDLNAVDFHVANKELLNVSTQMEYSIGSNSSYTACTDGTMTGIDYVFGRITVREIAKTDNKRVLIYVKKPYFDDFTIDYINKTTKENVADNIEYSTDDFATAGTLGSNAPVDLTLGKTIYFRIPATKTSVEYKQTLTVPVKKNSNKLSDSITDCAVQTQIDKEECHALIDLYTNTNGASWKNKSGWNVTNTPCSWRGVSCGGDGHVTGLILRNNKLSGSIPESLSNLSNLKSLVLGSNQLSGSIPESLGNLSNLQRLFLFRNQLSGSIPESLGNLGNLKSLNLSSNQLSGSIPESLGNLSNLEYLKLYKNQLCENIPKSLMNLSKIRKIVLKNNHLTASDPKLIDWLKTKDSSWAKNQTPCPK
ncbi:MAG: hypothetical protein KAI83_12775 [Thiomargarita sp.]|nr:hypothetical protein [Thiomargarita sp.]